MIRATLTGVESRLDPRDFARVHRSAIVRLAAVREVAVRSTGDYGVHLMDGTELTLSRSYRDAFLAAAEG